MSGAGQLATPLHGLAPTATAREFQQHIHVFRGIAICLIVGAHSIPSFDWTERPLVGRLIDVFCNQSSVLFFFIAGYLFQYLSRNFSFQRYLKQKLKTVILPYLLVSIPAIVISVFFIPQEGMWPWFYDLPAWQQIGLFYLTGKHLEPLWFVPTITLFYFAAPLLLKIDRMPRLYWVILPLLLLSIALGRGGPLGPINKAIYLLPAYLFGMCFSHFRVEAEAIAGRHLLSLSVAALGAYAWLVAFPTEAFDLQILMKILMVPIFVVLLRRYSDRLNGQLDYVAHVSFGIFFVHAYFISAFRLVLTQWQGNQWAGEATTALFPPSVLGYLVHIALVLAASIASIWTVQKLFPDHSRQLIGA